MGRDSATPFIIGIGGGTASGKTTFARDLSERIGRDHSCVIDLDSYYFCQAHLSPEERIRVNYDHPDSIEHTLLAGHLATLLNGEAISVPRYDFACHSRHPVNVKRVEPRRVIIIEGILALHFPHVRELYSLKVFVQAPSDVRFARRLSRDVSERGRSAEGVQRQWCDTVEPMHQVFCAPSREWADLVIDGTKPFDEPLNEVVRLAPAPR